MELFASSFDLESDGYFMRHALPFITPSVGLDAIGKTIGFLLQVFFVAVPNFLAVRASCNAIRAFCTDMGAERNMVGMIDFLLELFRFIGDP